MRLAGVGRVATFLELGHALDVRVLAVLCLGSAACVSAGLLAGGGMHLPLLLGLLVIGVATFVLHDWRWGIYGLLLYIPFSGIPSHLMYPNTAPAALAKDFLFVLPAYCGFLLQAMMRRQSIAVPGAPVAWMAVLAGIVLVQVFNPNLPNLLVGLVGLKLWLLYIPLFFLGYHLVSTKRQLFFILGLISIPAIVPAAIGILQAVLHAGGQSDLVYNAYGESASASTQGLYGTHYEGGGVLRRVASTFPFMTQYYLYCASMVAAIHAWRSGLPGGMGAGRTAGLALWLTLVVAALLSGSRGAFLTVPLLLALLWLLSGRRGPALLSLTAGLGALAAVVAILGANLDAVLNLGLEIGSIHVTYGPWDTIPKILEMSPLGFGAGTASPAARYILESESTVGAVRLLNLESFMSATLADLGVPGVVAVAGLLGALLLRALKDHLRLTDPALKAVSAALIALCIWVVVYSLTASYLFSDPVNVYFWLFLGLAARLPSLGSR